MLNRVVRGRLYHSYRSGVNIKLPRRPVDRAKKEARPVKFPELVGLPPPPTGMTRRSSQVNYDRTGDSAQPEAFVGAALIYRYFQQA